MAHRNRCFTYKKWVDLSMANCSSPEGHFPSWMMNQWEFLAEDPKMEVLYVSTIFLAKIAGDIP